MPQCPLLSFQNSLVSVAVSAESRGLCWTPHHLLPSPRGQKVKMRPGRETAEIQATEFIPAQTDGGPIAPCFLKLPKASWQGWRCCVGSWLQGFGGSSSKRFLDLCFLGVGPSRNFGVLPSNSLGGRRGRRKRGRGLGIAALMEAQRTGCSCCLHGNQYLRGRGLSGISSWRVSIIPHLCPTLLLSP